MSGAEWKAIEIPPEAECQPRNTESEPEMHAWFLDALFARAKALLEAREVTSVDVAEAQLKQALLHARAPELQKQRALIANWLGDVGYWRASAKLKDAATALTEVAKLFEAAHAANPANVKDAAAWALYIKKIVNDLHVGPDGAAPLASDVVHTPAKPAHEPAPMGSALPVEAGSGASSGSATPPAVVAPPDAGVSAGGVLL